MLSPPIPSPSFGPPPTATGRAAIDIAIVIDCSGSMSDEADSLSKAAEAGLKAAQTACPADVKVHWFGIKGTWNHTKFDRNLLDYLKEDRHVSVEDIRITMVEDGARSVEDLANHFAWRPGARRTIFFLGDDALEHGGGRVDEEDIKANDIAISAAKAAKASVYTYFGTNNFPTRGEIHKEYERLSQETGGKSYSSEDGISWEDRLKDVICTETQTVTGPQPQPGPMMPYFVFMPMMPMMMCMPMPMPMNAPMNAPWGYMMPMAAPCPCQNNKPI